MKTLGIEHAIYVPAMKATGTNYSTFLAMLAHHAGGYTQIPAKGGWTDSTGQVVEEDIVIVSARHEAFDYAAQTLTERAFEGFTKALFASGEQSVMRVYGDRAWIADSPHEKPGTASHRPANGGGSHTRPLQ